MNDVDDDYELLDILQYQSGCASISYHDPNHPTLAGKTAYICTQEQLDKFAELIIQECAKAYHKTRLSEVPIETHFKKHFGVWS